MLKQRELISKVRAACEEDKRLDAAMMYGSFTRGEADEYSDIEFWLFFLPKRLPIVRPHDWCGQIGPFSHLVRNEFGADVVFFKGLIRGEFHFATADDIPDVANWPARGAPVEDMVVVDRTGALRAVLEALPLAVPTPTSSGEINDICGRFANWLVLAYHLTSRGEYLRAWDALGHVQRHLTWMARLSAHNTDHWLTPAQGAEQELRTQDLRALARATSSAAPQDLRVALRDAWRSGREYWTTLAHRHHFFVPDDLLDEIDNAR